MQDISASRRYRGDSISNDMLIAETVRRVDREPCHKLKVRCQQIASAFTTTSALFATRAPLLTG